MFEIFSADHQRTTNDSQALQFVNLSFFQCMLSTDVSTPQDEKGEVLQKVHPCQAEHFLQVHVFVSIIRMESGKL